MNNEKYKIIDEVYENYEKDTPEQHVVGSDYDPMKHTMIWKRKICPLSGYPILERFSKEEFINKCKTDVEFAKKWGLTIYTEVEGDEVYMGIVYNGNAAKIKIK